MPIEFRTSLDLDLVYSAWWGHVTMDEWRDSFFRYRNDAYYRPGRTKLNDLSGVDSLDADFNALWSALNRVNDHVNAAKVRSRVVLIVHDEVVYGQARIFQSLSQNADGVRVEIHRSEESALAALAVPYRSVFELLEAEDFLPPALVLPGADGS